MIVLRHPDPAGRLLAAVLREMGIPVALESSVGLAATQVGGALIALCRAATDESAVSALLAHLRLDPALAPGAVDTVEARIRRGDATTVTEAVAHWDSPPRHLQRLREAETAAQRLRALARSARELAEAPHRDRAPLAGGPSPDRRAVLGPRAARGGRRRRAAHRARRARPRCPVARFPTSRARSRRSSRRRCRSGAGRPTGRVRILEPVPGARGARPGPLLPLAPGRRLPQRRAARPAALRGPPPRDRQSRTCAAPTPRTRSATCSTPASRARRIAST